MHLPVLDRLGPIFGRSRRDFLVPDRPSVLRAADPRKRLSNYHLGRVHVRIKSIQITDSHQHLLIFLLIVIFWAVPGASELFVVSIFVTCRIHMC